MSDASAGLQDSARANARSPLSTVMRARAGIKVRIKDCTLTPFYNAKNVASVLFLRAARVRAARGNELAAIILIVLATISSIVRANSGVKGRRGEGGTSEGTVGEGMHRKRKTITDRRGGSNAFPSTPLTLPPLCCAMGGQLTVCA